MKHKQILIFQGLPLFVLLLPFAWFGLVGNDAALKGEFGIIENMTVVFLVVAIGYCIASVMQANRQSLSVNLKAWLVVMIAGSAYFALEEISYGQHLFGWSTAETWKELNNQEETNLHNVHPVFDQLPRALLTLGILVGGVLIPLYFRIRKIQLPESHRFYWQLPTMDCVSIGLIAILFRPVFSVFEFDFINTGESKENFFALFILLYCVSIYLRLLRRQD